MLVGEVYFTWSRFLRRSFRSEEKWDGKRTWKKDRIKLCNSEFKPNIKITFTKMWTFIHILFLKFLFPFSTTYPSRDNFLIDLDGLVCKERWVARCHLIHQHPQCPPIHGLVVTLKFIYCKIDLSWILFLPKLKICCSNFPNPTHYLKHFVFAKKVSTLFCKYKYTA